VLFSSQPVVQTRCIFHQMWGALLDQLQLPASKNCPNAEEDVARITGDVLDASSLVRDEGAWRLRQQCDVWGCWNCTPLQPEDLGSSEDVPEFQRRDFILKGYRLYTCGWSSCLRSTLRLHNETVNIWTHGLGVLLVAYRGYISFTDHRTRSLQQAGALTEEGILIVLLYLVTLLCLMLSTLFHTRSCDTEKVCYYCFYADLFGVILLLVVSLCVGIAICLRCFPLARWTFVICTVLQVFILSAAVFLPRISDSARAVVFVLCALYGLLPLGYVYLMGPKLELDLELLLPAVGYMLLWYLSGVAAYVARFPEFLAPGSFDYFGQSHNIWHICVLAGMLIWINCAQKLAELNSGTLC